MSQHSKCSAPPSQGSSGSGGGEVSPPPPKKKRRASPIVKMVCRISSPSFEKDKWFQGSVVPWFQQFMEFTTKKYVMQLERGEETERLHIQGAFILKKKQRCTALAEHVRNFSEELSGASIWFRKMAGSWEDQQKYCAKKDTRVAGPWGDLPEDDMSIDESYFKHKFFKWQEAIVESVSVPDPVDQQSWERRWIYWFWDHKGGIGKTYLAKWLAWRHKAVIVSGKKRHILATAFKSPNCRLYVFIIPRSAGDLVSYQAIEAIKDGLFHAGFGTECCGMVNRKHPQVLVLANQPPQLQQLSDDRWVIQEITEAWKGLPTRPGPRTGAGARVFPAFCNGFSCEEDSLENLDNFTEE